ncbi:MAG: hypothetical protein ACP5VE_03575 [Chthonomonadales bacterium]
MSSFDLEVHPVYGAVPADGDMVQPGEVLGLSPDGTALVEAPVAGRVHICRVQLGDGHRTIVRIVPHRTEDCCNSTG